MHPLAVITLKKAHQRCNWEHKQNSPVQLPMAHQSRTEDILHILLPWRLPKKHPLSVVLIYLLNGMLPDLKKDRAGSPKDSLMQADRRRLQCSCQHYKQARAFDLDSWMRKYGWIAETCTNSRIGHTRHSYLHADKQKKTDLKSRPRSTRKRPPANIDILSRRLMWKFDAAD